MRPPTPLHEQSLGRADVVCLALVVALTLAALLV